MAGKGRIVYILTPEMVGNGAIILVPMLVMLFAKSGALQVRTTSESPLVKKHTIVIPQDQPVTTVEPTDQPITTVEPTDQPITTVEMTQHIASNCTGCQSQMDEVDMVMIVLLGIVIIVLIGIIAVGGFCMHRNNRNLLVRRSFRELEGYLRM